MRDARPVRPFPVVEGGKLPLGDVQRRALSYFADAVRGLTPRETEALIDLIHEFRRDRYLNRARAFELPVVKVLADVINGWEPDGIQEFARAWTSTLVSREDDFDWSDCSPEEKAAHSRRVRAEMVRRGI